MIILDLNKKEVLFPQLLILKMRMDQVLIQVMEYQSKAETVSKNLDLIKRTCLPQIILKSFILTCYSQEKESTMNFINKMMKLILIECIRKTNEL